MTGRNAIVIGIFLGMLSAPAIGQEQGYNEDRIRPSKVPQALRARAEKEAPGAKFSVIYTDNNEGYRFVGKKDDGSWVSVRFGIADSLRIWNWKEVTLAKAPKAVARTLQATIRDPKAAKPGYSLAGFTPRRLWLVDEFKRFNGKEEKSTFYEYLGKTNTVFHVIRISPAGERILVDSPLINSNYRRQRQVLAPRVLGLAMQVAMAQIVPSFKATRVIREVDDPEFGGGDNYVIHGQGTRGRRYVFTGFPPHTITTYQEQVDPSDVPADALASARKQADSDREQAGFRPVEAWRKHWGALDGKIGYLLYGDDIYGRPIVLEVEPSGSVMASADTRDEWEVGPQSINLGERVPPSGFAVLAARYGRVGWIDATDYARDAIASGLLKSGNGGVLPDPSYGEKKAMAVMYSSRGQVRLIVQPEGEMSLPPLPGPDNLADVPAKGFAVLAARFGVGESWADATEAVRARVSGGRLDAPVSEMGLPNPAPDQGKTLIVAYAQDGLVGLQHFPEGGKALLPWALPPANSSALEAHKVEFPGKVNGVAFGPEGRIAAAVDDGTVRLIDASTGEEVRKLDGHGAGWTAVALSARGSLVLSGGGDKVLRSWDATTGKPRSIFRGHTSWIRRVALSPSGRLAASSADDSTIRIWDAASGRELRKIEGHTAPVDCLAFTPDSRSLVSTSWDHSLKVWDPNTGRELRKYDGGCPLGSFSLSGDGKTAFVGADDRTVRRVELASAREVAGFPTNCEAGLGTTVMRDARRFFAADGTSVLLWDVASDRPALRLERHTARIRGIALAPDSRMAVSGGDDNTLRVWNLP